MRVGVVVRTVQGSSDSRRRMQASVAADSSRQLLPSLLKEDFCHVVGSGVCTVFPHSALMILWMKSRDGAGVSAIASKRSKKVR
jgi:hypothetical protein